MFEITGTRNGTKETVVWDDGQIYASQTFTDAVSDMEESVTEGPVPVVFEYPRMSDAWAAAQVIEFLFDDVTSTTGPVISWDDCLQEGEEISKHPGPRGSALHATGTDQSVHGGSRISPFNEGMHGSENSMQALEDLDYPPYRGATIGERVIAKWEAVTGISRRKIVNQYRRMLKEAAPHSDYESWKYWYDDVHDLSTSLGEKHGFTTDQVAAAFAAFSPGVNWQEELKAIPHLVEMMDTDPPVPEGSLELVNAKILADDVLTGRNDGNIVKPQILQPGQRVSDLGNPRAAAIAYAELARASEAHENWAIPYGYAPLMDSVMILRGADIDTTLRGVTTRSFYNNMMMPEDPRDVTIDFQMMEAAARRAITKNEKSGLSGTPGVTINGLETDIGVRPYLADIVRQVANESGLLPNQAQAIIWSQWKEEK